MRRWGNRASLRTSRNEILHPSGRTSDNVEITEQKEPSAPSRSRASFPTRWSEYSSSLYPGPATMSAISARRAFASCSDRKRLSIAFRRPRFPKPTSATIQGCICQKLGARPFAYRHSLWLSAQSTSSVGVRRLSRAPLARKPRGRFSGVARHNGVRA